MDPRVEQFMAQIIAKNQNENEFHQAVQEVAESLIPFIEENPKYKHAKVLERIAEPERVILFRIPWLDDKGEIQINKGYRIEMNSAIGPYKGGLRFHPTVNLSILKFLAFEQVFKNSLTTLPMGGGKGGSDFNPKGKWGYTAGLVAKSMVELWKQIGEIKYYDYAKSYADQFINANGEIKGYKRSDFNIDNVNSGNFLFDLYQNTQDDRYKKAIFILRDQLNDHPRTTEGGFWHKKRYTHQMWLDGLYMGEPFYARFGSEFNEPEAFDDIINQFVVVHKHTYNSEVGLNYHGWDESKEQAWAIPENGCSPHFWGRAMGWYAMALVDILDFIPENHPKREELIGIVKQVVAGIEKVQDPKTGLWYQVLDLGNKEGNYLESSCSCMFVYSLLKASRLNYIDKRYHLVAEKGYDGILKNFIKENIEIKFAYKKGKIVIIVMTISEVMLIYNLLYQLFLYQSHLR